MNLDRRHVINAVVNRVTSVEVRAFAQQMIADHTKLRDALVAVAANPAASPSRWAAPERGGQTTR